MSPFAGGASAGSYEYATASRSCGASPACSRHQAAACSGSSHVENGTGVLPCLRREKRSSSAAATVSPSTTSAAAGSWNTALTPRTFPMEGRPSEKRFSANGNGHRNDRCSAGVIGDRAQPLERPPDEARDVHLGDADALRDLGLREVLDEPQVQH